MSEAKKLNALSDDELKNVRGGLVFFSGNTPGADQDHPFEVLDDKNGRVLYRASSYQDAKDWISKSGLKVSIQLTGDWKLVERLRSDPR